MPFSAVLARVLALAGPGPRGCTPDDLAAILLQAIGVGLVDVRATLVPCVTTVSQRPVASRIARWQAARSGAVTTLRHAAIRLEGPLMRTLVTLMDGSRTIGDLIAAIQTLVHDQAIRLPASSAARSDISVAVEAEVHAAIRRLQQLALLEA